MFSALSRIATFANWISVLALSIVLFRNGTSIPENVWVWKRITPTRSIWGTIWKWLSFWRNPETNHFRSFHPNSLFTWNRVTLALEIFPFLPTREMEILFRFECRFLVVPISLEIIFWLLIISCHSLSDVAKIWRRFEALFEKNLFRLFRNLELDEESTLRALSRQN